MNLSATKKVYNQDVAGSGRYLYTVENVYSAAVATRKQSEEIHNLIRNNFPEKIRILDAGCGDGTYTLEIARVIRPEKITGFDIADAAIKYARSRIPNNLKKVLTYYTGSAYRLKPEILKKKFDLTILRGVLHHMDYPQKAIREIIRTADSVIILEPNGYNPILKLIEKTSPYHVRHGEKSYWPPDLDKWFRQNGFEVIYKKYFSIVPYFCPKILTDILKHCEPFFENIPFLNRFYCGGILVLYHKTRPVS